MKILLAGILAGQGGIQSHLRWLSKALGEEGIETLTLSLGSAHTPPVDESFLRQSWNDNVQLRCCTAYTSSQANRGLDGIRRLKEITKIIDEFDPDIYLAVGTGWNLFIPPLLSRSKPIRIFHEVMSGIPNGWKDSRWCVRFSFEEIVGQSKTVSQSFKEHFQWKKSVVALPAFPEPLELTANLPRLSSHPSTKRYIKAALFSRLVAHKQAFWLVQQWEALKEVVSELHIHGTGPDEAKIQEFIDKEKLGDYIRCHGKYPEGQAYIDLLSSYDMTLLPTIGEEGAPLVLLESMACGVPFVANAVGGIRDYVEDNSYCIATSPNRESFVSGVKQLSNNLRNGEINRKTIQELYMCKYSYEALKEKWIYYLKNVRTRRVGS